MIKLTLDPIVKVNAYYNQTAEGTNRFIQGLILGNATVIDTTERVHAYESASAMLDDGFQETDDEYLAAKIYFSAEPAPCAVLIGRIGTSETPAQSYTACLAVNAAFYGVYVPDATDAQLTTLAAMVESSDHVLFYDDDTATASGAASGIFATMNAAGYKRSIGIWSVENDNAGAALMGLACGLCRRYNTTAWALAYKQLAALVPENVSESDVMALKGVNANVYVQRGNGINLLELGQMANGYRFDEIMFVDMIADDARNAIVNMLVSTYPKLPQNDSTNAMFISALSTVCTKYAAGGVLEGGIWNGDNVGALANGDAVQNGYYIYAKSFDTLSTAERSAKKCPDLWMCLLLSGSVESVTIQVPVQR